MAIWASLKAAASGNFSDAGNYLFMDADAVSTNEQVGNAQEKLIAERTLDGTYSEEKSAALTSALQRNAYPYIFDDYGGPGETFVAEVKTGATNLPKNIAGLINQTVGGVGDFIRKSLPWWIWVLGAIGIVIYLAPLLKTVGKMKGK